MVLVYVHKQSWGENMTGKIWETDASKSDQKLDNVLAGILIKRDILAESGLYFL